MLKNLKLDLSMLYDKVSFAVFFKALLLNPSFQAVFIIRLCLNSGKLGYWIFRNILIMKHSIDVGYGAIIGGGLCLPHPINIVIGKGCKVGDFVTLYQGVTLGQKKNIYPILLNSVIVYPNSIIIGNVTVGVGKKIPPMTLVEKDLL